MTVSYTQRIDRCSQREHDGRVPSHWKVVSAIKLQHTRYQLRSVPCCERYGSRCKRREHSGAIVLLEALL